MPWILLAILLLFTQLFLWSSFGSYLNDKNTGGASLAGIAGIPLTPRQIESACADIQAGRPPTLPPIVNVETLRIACTQVEAQLQQIFRERYNAVTLPGSLTGIIPVAQNIGLILIAILTASTLGSEHAWGTVRSILARGTGRRQYLAAKLALMVMAGIVAMTLVIVGIVLSSLVIGSLLGEPPLGAASSSWTDAAISLGKSWLALMPFIALAAFITVITRSSAAGIALSLGYNFLEGITTAIMINLFRWFQTVADYLLGRNITAWMISGQTDLHRAGGLGGLVGTFPGELHAILVLMVYILALGGLALWVFQRRDIPASGGG
ncbi:MAG: ABC transporter permease subunit [Chloroflexi bacterium]|nr:ABC transporter permease subunit [Chloroflexota bacterium]